MGAWFLVEVMGRLGWGQRYDHRRTAGMNCQAGSGVCVESGWGLQHVPRGEVVAMTLHD